VDSPQIHWRERRAQWFRSFASRGKDLEGVSIDRPLGGEGGRALAIDWDGALHAKRSASPANFGGLKRNYRVRVIRANRACSADLQRLVAGGQRRDSEMRLQPILVFQWPLQRGAKFRLS